MAPRVLRSRRLVAVVRMGVDDPNSWLDEHNQHVGAQGAEATTDVTRERKSKQLLQATNGRDNSKQRAAWSRGLGWNFVGTAE